MKKSKILLVVLLTVTIFSGALAAVGIILLPAEIAPPESYVQENVSGLPYGEETPETSLLICFPDSSGVFLFLDFPSLLTHTYIFGDSAEENAAALPYPPGYKIEADFEFLALLSDRLGGLEITGDTGEKSLYFSSAVREFCEKGLNEEKRQILALSFFDKIAKTGLSSEDFMFIIEETDNNLSYSVCYDWISYVRVMLSNIIYE